MRGALRLDGKMIPRQVKRMFDQRGEVRALGATPTLFEWRGLSLPVGLANVSASGAMVVCDEIPNSGESVSLQLPDGRLAPGVVRWVRDGRIGIHFVARLG